MMFCSALVISLFFKVQLIFRKDIRKKIQLECRSKSIRFYVKRHHLFLWNVFFFHFFWFPKWHFFILSNIYIFIIGQNHHSFSTLKIIKYAKKKNWPKMKENKPSLHITLKNSIENKIWYLANLFIHIRGFE